MKIAAKIIFFSNLPAHSVFLPVLLKVFLNNMNYSGNGFTLLPYPGLGIGQDPSPAQIPVFPHPQPTSYLTPL